MAVNDTQALKLKTETDSKISKLEQELQSEKAKAVALLQEKTNLLKDKNSLERDLKKAQAAISKSKEKSSLAQTLDENKKLRDEINVLREYTSQMNALREQMQNMTSQLDYTEKSWAQKLSKVTEEHRREQEAAKQKLGELESIKRTFDEEAGRLNASHQLDIQNLKEHFVQEIQAARREEQAKVAEATEEATKVVTLRLNEAEALSNSLKSQITEMEALHAAAKDRLKQAMSDWEHEQAKCSNLANQVQQKQGQLEAVRADLTTQLNALQTRCDALEKTILDQEQQIQSERQKAANAQRAVDAANELVSKANARISLLESHIESTQAESDSMKTAHEQAMSVQSKRHDEALATLRQELDSEKNAYSSVASELESWKKESAASDKRRNDLIQEYERRLQQVQAASDSALEQHQQALAEIEKKTLEETQKFQEQIRSLENALSTTRDSLEAKISECNANKAAIQKSEVLAVELQSLKTTEETLQTKIQVYENQINALQARLSEQSQVMQVMERSNADVQSQLLRTKEEITSLMDRDARNADERLEQVRATSRGEAELLRQSLNEEWQKRVQQLTVDFETKAKKDESTIHQLQTKMQEQEALVMNIKSTHASSIQSFQGQNEQVMREREQASIAIDQLQKTIKSLENDLKEKDAQLLQCQSLAQVQLAELSGLKNNQSDTKPHDHVIEEIQRLKSEKSGLEVKLNETIAALRQEIAELKSGAEATRPATGFEQSQQMADVLSRLQEEKQIMEKRAFMAEEELALATARLNALSETMEIRAQISQQPTDQSNKAEPQKTSRFRFFSSRKPAETQDTSATAPNTAKLQKTIEELTAKNNKLESELVSLKRAAEATGAMVELL